MKNMKNTGFVLCIGGDNGTGKSSFSASLSSNDNFNTTPSSLFEEPISATTRKPRMRDDGTMEEHGVEYLFVSEFNKRDYLEYTESKNKEGSIYYGTLLSELVRIWEAGKVPTPVLDAVGIKAFIDQDFNAEVAPELKRYLENKGVKKLSVSVGILDIPKSEVFVSLLEKYPKLEAMKRLERGTIREDIERFGLKEYAKQCHNGFISKSYSQNNTLIKEVKEAFQKDLCRKNTSLNKKPPRPK